MDMTGFLFGNVNEEGELEDESLLDKVSSLNKAHTIKLTGSTMQECVSQLSRLGVAGELSELDLVCEGEDQLNDNGDNEMAKSPTAEDFMDITEVCGYGVCVDMFRIARPVCAAGGGR